MPLSNLKGAPGYTPPQTAGGQVMGGLERILDLLNRPGAAVRGGIYGAMDATDKEDPVSGVWKGLSGQRRFDTTELLGKLGWQKPGWGRSAAGFVGDVATDPLTFAGGALFKGASKGLGLAGKGVRALGAKVEPLGTALEVGDDIGKWLGHVFNPAAGLPAGYGDMARLSKARLRGVRQDVAQQMQDIYQGLTPVQRRVALAAQEAGWARDPLIETARAKKAQYLSDLFDEEVKWGLQAPEAKLPNYAEHVLRKGDEYAAKNKVGRMLSAKLGFAKKRTLPTLEEALKRGAEPDAAIAGFHRGVAGKKATLSAQHIVETAKKFGKVADANGEYGEGFYKLVGGGRGSKGADVLGDARFFNQLVDMGNGQMVKLKDIGLPDGILKDLYATFIRTPKDERTPGVVRNALGTLNRWFREGATVLRPGFHMTNLQGNLWNMSLAGMNPIEGAIQTAKRGKQLWSGKPVYTDILNPDGSVRVAADKVAEAIDRFNISSPQSTFAGSMGDDMVDRLKQALDGKQGRPGIIKRYGNLMKKVGSSIEGGSKEALFLKELQRGKSVDEAAATVNKFLFDYADLTQTEKRIRNFLPFYTWSRKNIPLQAEMLLKRPAQYAGVGKVKHAVEDVTAGQGKLVADQDRPEYLRAEGAIQLPWSKKGEARYYTPYLPFKDLNMLPIPGVSRGVTEIGRDVAGMLTPYAKMPAEWLLNKNLLTGNRLYDENLGYFSDWQERKGIPMPLPAAAHHALSNVNPFLPYTTKTAGALWEGDLGGILGTLGLRAPLTDAKTVARDRKKAQTARKQAVASRKRQPTPISDTAEEAVRALRILKSLSE